MGEDPRGAPRGHRRAGAGRAEKRIDSSLQAAPTVYMSAAEKAAFEGLDAAEIFITSGATLSEGTGPDAAYRLSDVAGVACDPTPAAGDKCERCWRVLPEVAVGDPICDRCEDAVSGLVDAAE